MIRIPITETELNRQIEAQVPGWLNRATRRTEGFRQRGRYQESATIWSEVKEMTPAKLKINHDAKNQS